MAAVLAVASAAMADQLAWNAREVSERGARAIRPDTLLVSYCSLADQEAVEVWRVKSVEVTETETPGFYEVNVVGERLFRSEKTFDSGRYAEPVRYREIPPDDNQAVVREGIDLAYVYVPSDGATFRCLGKALDLDCEVEVETITLPEDVLAAAAKRIAAQPEGEKPDRKTSEPQN